MILTRIKGKKNMGVKWLKPEFFDTRESVVQGPVFCVSMYYLVFKETDYFSGCAGRVLMDVQYSALLQCDRCHTSTLQLRKSFSDIITEYESHIGDRLFLDTIATVRIVLECITIIYIRVRAVQVLSDRVYF
jgi:hypothetical protein